MGRIRTRIYGGFVRRYLFIAPTDKITSLMAPKTNKKISCPVCGLKNGHKLSCSNNPKNKAKMHLAVQEFYDKLQYKGD